LSEFRDRIRHNVVTAAGHPSRAYDMLVELEEGMRLKIKEGIANETSEDFRNGLIEQWAFVSNMRDDVAREYGYEEGK
jgi:hypothetical protein